MNATDSKKLRLLLKDCAKGFYQQMYFWGKDVSHPSGNQLQRYGFQRTPSQGLRGTSCYSYVTPEMTIELYGSCAAFYTEQTSLVFLRRRNRFYRWIADHQLVAGCWSQADLGKCNADAMFHELVPFLQWWLHYEQWIFERHGAEYRAQCHREWSKVNPQNTWLEPPFAMEWVKEFIRVKEAQPRPKQFMK